MAVGPSFNPTGVLLMATLFGAYPFLLKLYADGGYQGPQSRAGLARATRQVRPKAGQTGVEVEIVKRSDAATGFVVLPKRWIVERTRGAHGATPGSIAAAGWPRIGNA